MSVTTTLNREMFAKVRDVIVQHPEAYDQAVFFEPPPYGYDDEEPQRPDDYPVSRGEQMQYVVDHNYSCGAVACVAGHAALLWDVMNNPDHIIELDGYHRTTRDVIDISGAGAKALGLNEYQAEWLFAGSREAETMPAILTMLAEGHSFVDMLKLFAEEIDYQGYLKWLRENPTETP